MAGGSGSGSLVMAGRSGSGDLVMAVGSRSGHLVMARDLDRELSLWLGVWIEGSRYGWGSGSWVSFWLKGLARGFSLWLGWGAEIRYCIKCLVGRPFHINTIARIRLFVSRVVDCLASVYFCILVYT